jgi:hypothetical protein
MIRLLARGIAFLTRIGLRGVVDRSLGVLEAQAKDKGRTDRAQIEMATEIARATVAEVEVRADLEKARMGHWPFWVFVALFMVPLGVWWSSVLWVSTFPWLGWTVHDLPNEHMREWAGWMLKWLFGVTSAAGAARIALGRR